MKTYATILTIFLLALVGTAQTLETYEAAPEWPKNPPKHWVRYHLAHPDPKAGFFPGDPNPALYYKGKYHLHYLYSVKGGLAMAHVSSDDMVHWKWHKTTLGPKSLGHGMLSGTAFLTKEGKPAIIYSDNRNIMIVYGLDDNLDSWTEPAKVVAKTKDGHVKKVGVWDPDCWLNGDTYYCTGSGDKQSHLIKSKDLKHWEYLGDLMHSDFPNNLGVTPNDDLSCPNMFKLGDKWMLLSISHTLGCRYFIGDFKDEKYLPESHGLMNWQNINHGKRGLGFFFAPESMLTPDNRRVMWAWLFPEKKTQQGLQSLPREIELAKDGTIRIQPLRELQKLRGEMKTESNIVLKNLKPYQLKEMSGDALEFEVVFKPLDETYKLNRPHVLHVPRSFGMNVLCDVGGSNGVQISICPSAKTLRINDVVAPLEVEIDKEISLRVFIDNTVIEVFANDRQAIAYAHTRKHPHANNYLFAEQGNMPVKTVTAWEMNSIYTKAADRLK
tara:strand:+ start:575 stop:2065 length:1491 start_codon:yes stop_codon:yes gene_type:complete